MIRRLIFTLLVLAAASTPASAQEVSAALRMRAEQVSAVIRGEGELAQIFTPEFLAAVPEAQLRAVGAQLTQQYGAAGSLAGIEPSSPTAAVILVDTERARLRLNLNIEDAPPHRIRGLVVAGADVRGDTLAALTEELRALPGEVSFAVARLDERGPALLAGHRPDAALAIGSAFKLIVLAELSRQVRAGERRWSDVVALDRSSLPSGTLHAWPAGAPVTLHTLAALMISISDNTATDMLIYTLGRDRIEGMMATLGIHAPARNRPFLTTLELFGLKTATDADFADWMAADEAGRRRILAASTRRDAAGIDPNVLGGGPRRIAQIEWFASAADLIRVMDWLRRNGDEHAQAILAINPGGPASLRQDFSFVGFKGGSEPGVFNGTWLVRNRAGAWHVVTASWNNQAATLEQARFVGLMGRALQLVR